MESVAVCLFNSFLDGAHERAAGGELERSGMGQWVSLSSEVMPTMGEYERGSTAVVNAYIAPKVTGYLQALDRQLRQLGLPNSLLLLQSNGGAVSVDQVAARPVMLVLKVTPTMLTSDLAPSRLERARQKIADLLKAHDGMPAGLIAYSGSAHLVLPPTPDREIVLSLAHALSPDIMPREGDRLDEAVALADRILKEGGQGGSIVVLADTVQAGQTFAALFTLLAMLPESTPLPALSQRVVRTTVDDADIEALEREME